MVIEYYMHIVMHIAICLGVASYVQTYICYFICTCIESSFHKEWGRDLETDDYDAHYCDDTRNQASVTPESQVNTLMEL